MPERWIAHVDMDAFFVSAELLRRPELKGKPVVVATGTDPGARGVVMAASYEARRFGVHSAVPLAIAHRRCPEAVLITRDMAYYRELSGKVMAMLGRYSDRVEVVGLDEAYLDLTDSAAPRACGRRIKHEVKQELDLICSVGLAPNKLLAKIASDLDKPDGFRVLLADELLSAVGDRPASLIPGVGPKTAERLGRRGIATVADLANADPVVLESAVGPRLGASLRARANGRDERSVETEREPKSESRETTFAQDVDDPRVLAETLDRLLADLCRGLEGARLRGRTVTLKIRLRPFRTHTRSRTIDSHTRDPALIARIAYELLGAFERDAPVRLLGVGIASLVRDEGRDESAAETGQERLELLA
jgi:nucleotidyltransferase/DNA polymerase involved in DNA repair